MGVVERIMEHAERLTSTERKIAEVLAGEPQTIAFGTVAQVAQRAGTSGPSVVRLAVKLGYEGFVGLQADVQSELARQLGPARDRIRQRPPTDFLARVQAAEQDNVLRTLHGISTAALDRSIARLADRHHQVWVLPAEMTAPIGMVLASQLGQLRDGVTLLEGSEVAMSRALAGLEPRDTLIPIDIRRYERSLVGLTRWAAERGAAVLAVTDSPLSPLVAGAAETFFISAQGVGPFDSVTGGIALANVLIAGVAARLRQTAPARLDAIEAAWSAMEALVAEPGGSGPLAGIDRITHLHGNGADDAATGGGGAGAGGDGASGPPAS
ncbi:MAG TPA: MurR/RpiR family transcriptional regulator [Acidimicrobiales bacterium]|jgi:DNA-binding MurR/RpiR family transcriptional regulator